MRVAPAAAAAAIQQNPRIQFITRKYIHIYYSLFSVCVFICILFFWWAYLKVPSCCAHTQPYTCIVWYMMIKLHAKLLYPSGWLPLMVFISSNSIWFCCFNITHSIVRFNISSVCIFAVAYFLNRISFLLWLIKKVFFLCLPLSCLSPVYCYIPGWQW